MCLPPTTHRTQACLQRKQDTRISHQDVSDTICFHPLRGCLRSILVRYSYIHFKKDKKKKEILEDRFQCCATCGAEVLQKQQKHATKNVLYWFE